MGRVGAAILSIPFWLTLPVCGVPNYLPGRITADEFTIAIMLGVEALAYYFRPGSTVRVEDQAAELSSKLEAEVCNGSHSLE